MIALALIVLIAFAVETMAGFGATVITVTLASQLFPVSEVLAALVPVNLLLSGYLVVRYRHEVDWHLVLRRGVLTMGLGVLVGLALYRLNGQAWMKAVFATFVIVLSAFELARLRRASEAKAASLPPALRLTALLSAGVMHGMFACGGPLLVYALSREIHEKGRFRATLSAIWLLLNGALVANLVRAGELGRNSLQTSTVLLVSLGLGVLIGERLHAKLPERPFRLTVFWLLLVAGTALLARTLFTGVQSR